ncbi:2-succinyl-6-hydroxy-2,4-cyclohexadiene-1-carboxylate synthase [PVC group bacterium (ex Bugula neritina AB1)]|nr:2-succinyl-6-hydroxy-2,4-cyclohexadiene-1-carboxylate synthase [PVC group bacterium (ex Bugula neritina AB1)]
MNLGHTFYGEPSRPLLILLHGFLANKEDWEGIIPHLIDTYYCLAIDLPGHGDTPMIKNQNDSLPNAAMFVNRFLDEKNIQQCDLLGYSMGGRLALQVLLQRPERFSRLILEGSCPGLKTEEGRLERVKNDGYIAKQIEKEKDVFLKYLLKWYQQPFFKSIKRKADLFEKFLELRLKNDPLQVAESLRCLGTGAQPSLWENLKDIKSDTCLIVGCEDDKFLTFCKEMATIIPSCELYIVEKCGHNVHVEQPEKHVKILKNFLKVDK